MKKLLVAITLAVASFALVSEANSSEVYIYGGDYESTFLGCANCDTYDSKSIFYRHGPYSFDNEKTSIFVVQPKFIRRFSDLSMCNPSAKHPPVLVDSDFLTRGHLTVDKRRAIYPTAYGLAVKICSRYHSVSGIPKK